jgi:hypothetical protein
MLHRILTTCSFVCCALVIASFALFAVDQLSGASKHQVAEIASGAPTSPGVTQSSSHHSGVRQVIDTTANALTSPFRSLVHMSNQWSEHIFVLVCGLTLYGLGLGYLARYVSVHT